MRPAIRHRNSRSVHRRVQWIGCFARVAVASVLPALSGSASEVSALFPPAAKSVSDTTCGTAAGIDCPLTAAHPSFPRRCTRLHGGGCSPSVVSLLTNLRCCRCTWPQGGGCLLPCRISLWRMRRRRKASLVHRTAPRKPPIGCRLRDQSAAPDFPERRPLIAAIRSSAVLCSGRQTHPPQISVHSAARADEFAGSSALWPGMRWRGCSSNFPPPADCRWKNPVDFR